MPRLFTGLEIPEDIGHSLSSLRGGLPGARWIDPENYHVTLRFIGDIDGVVGQRDRLDAGPRQAPAVRGASCRGFRRSAARSRARWWPRSRLAGR